MDRLRRQLCQGIGLLPLVGWTGCAAPPQAAAPTAALPDAAPPRQLTVVSSGQGGERVVELRWSAAVDPWGRVSAPHVRQMVHRGLRELLGTEQPFASWAGARQRICIKVNSIGSQAFTHPEVALPLARGLWDQGCSADRITIWDRDTASLRARGYKIHRAGRAGFRCMGSDAGVVAASPRPVQVAQTTVHLSPILVQSDLLLSVGALKDHSMAGVSLSLKNNFGMIQGAERLHGDFRHGSGCEPGISDLAALPDVRKRLQLVLVDALVGVCHGGPGPAQPEHTFRHAGLIFGLSPVAVDRYGMGIIEARRRQLSLPPLAARQLPNPSPPLHIDNAAAKGV